MPFPNALHALYKIDTIGRLALLPSQEDHDGRSGEDRQTPTTHMRVSCWDEVPSKFKQNGCKHFYSRIEVIFF